MAVVVINLAEKIGIKITPFLKTETLPVYPRRNSQRNHRRLNQQGSRSAHRVDECAFSAPARFQDHTRRQHLIERSISLRNAITAFVQRFAGTVQRKRAGFVRNVDIENQIGIGDAYGRTFVVSLVEPVNDGILHPVGYKFGMAENMGKNHRVDGKCLVQRQILVPVQLLDRLVNLVGSFSFKFINGFQYPQCGAAMHVCLIHHGFVAGKRNHSVSGFHICCTKVDEFFGKHIFKFCHRLGNQGEIF